jgi:ferritin
MITEETRQSLNGQIQQELIASNLYLQMSFWLKWKGFKNFAEWLLEQSCEEREHALKFCEYIDAQLSQVEILPIDAPKTDWEDLYTLAYGILLKEQEVTLAINMLMNQAEAIKDYATMCFLKWFINEQVKSENQANLILMRIGAIRGDEGALYNFDNEFDDLFEEE